MKRRLANSALLTMILSLTYAVGFAEPLSANSGTILSLTATDGPNPGDIITISSTVRADSSINNSNLYYRIYAPDGITIVATHQMDPPAMSKGDTFSDSWTTSNNSFPDTGTYTVHLCWSPGNSKNCQIAEAETTFYSVPTLGWFLTTVAVGLLGVWIWRRRETFRLEKA